MPVHVAVVSYAFLAEPPRRLPPAIGRGNQSERIALRRHRRGAAPLRGGKARTSAGRLAADGASTGSASALGRAAAFARQRRSSRVRGAALAQHRGQAQTGEHRAQRRGARRARAASAGCLSSNQPGPRLQPVALGEDRACGLRRGPALPARGGGGAGAPDRLCQRHQPGCTLGFTAARDGGQGGGRRQPRAWSASG